MNEVKLFACIIALVITMFAIVYNIWQDERIKKIMEENKNEKR